MRRLIGLLALVGALLASTVASATAERRVALVIGNGDYGDLGVLASPAADAAAVAGALADLGFEVILGVDRSAEALAVHLGEFTAALADADVGLVYYSGLALHAGAETWLLPVDGRSEDVADLDSEALPLDRVLAPLGRDGLIGLVFLDAVRPNPLVATMTFTADGEAPASGIGPVAPPPGMLIAVGAVPGTVASDGDGPHSVFTAALLQHIATPGLEVRLMLDRVGEEVAALTGGEQQPWVRFSGLGGGFVFNPEQEEQGAAPEDGRDDAPPIVGGIAPDEQPPGIIGMMGSAVPSPPPGTADDVAPNWVAPDTVAPDTVALTRHPVMDLPERVLPGEPFPLMIWLSRQSVTPEVTTTAGPDATVDETGALVFSLPDAADWRFRVVLNAPGFRIGDGGGPIAEIAMAADGDSTPALFLLTAEPGAHPDGRATLRATLWHGATYLASFERSVAVGVAATAAGNDRAEATTRPVRIDSATLTADLTIRVDYADPAALGAGQVIVASPHFRDPLVVGEIDTPAAVAGWLAQHYRQFIAARSQDLARGATHPDGPDGDAPLTEPLLRGFGQELYRRYAPEVFKQALWALLDDPAAPLATIQVYSNNPLMPWELMRPVSPDGTRELGYLGAEFLIARWHAGAGAAVFDRPRQELAFDELVAIAPDYGPGEALGSVAAELASLSAMPGFREVPGSLAALRALLEAPPRGIIHFAGHGIAATGADGLSDFLIRLDDLDLSVMAWRGLGAGAADDGLFYFFNACDVGRADSVANFVEGWAPAVLEGGAAGFIGGLWPVFDDSAADFAARFYADVEARLADGPAPVAAVLQGLRRRFEETGDPTWLGYVYYGDVNLRLVRGAD